MNEISCDFVLHLPFHALCFVDQRTVVAQNSFTFAKFQLGRHYRGKLLTHTTQTLNFDSELNMPISSKPKNVVQSSGIDIFRRLIGRVRELLFKIDQSTPLLFKSQVFPAIHFALQDGTSFSKWRYFVCGVSTEYFWGYVLC